MEMLKNMLKSWIKSLKTLDKKSRLKAGSESKLKAAIIQEVWQLTLRVKRPFCMDQFMLRQGVLKDLGLVYQMEVFPALQGYILTQQEYMLQTKIVLPLKENNLGLLIRAITPALGLI